MESYSLVMNSVEEIREVHEHEADAYEIEYVQLKRGKLEVSYRGVNLFDGTGPRGVFQQPVYCVSHEVYSNQLLLHGVTPRNRLGRFSVTYRELFDELPSATLKRPAA